MIKALQPTVLALLLVVAGCGAPREGVEEKFNFFPLARYEVSEKPEGHTVDVLWPLINAWRAGEANGSRAVPVYFHDDDGNGERFTNILALYWQTLDDDGSVRRDLFPFWHYVRDENEHATRLWPLYGVREYGGADHPYRSDLALWPLFSYDRAKDETWSELGLLSIWPLFGLFHRESDRTEDLLYGDTDTQVVSVFGDFIHVAQHRHARVEPLEETPDEPGAIRNEFSLVEISELFRLWGSDSTTGDGPTRHGLLTFFDESRLSLFTYEEDPRNDRSYQHLFPLWFQHDGPDDEGLYVLPLFGTARDDTLERTWVLPPLLGLENDPTRDLTAVDILYPLIRSSSEGSGAEAETHFRALPFAWFTTREDSAIRLALPLYYDIEDADSRYQHFIPFYGRNVEDDGATRTTFVIAPLFVRHEEDATSLTNTHILYPLIEFESSEDGQMSRFFPLYCARENGDERYLNVLGLFDHKENSEVQQTVVYPLFARSKMEESTTSSSVLPLLDLRFLDDHEPASDEVSVLFPLSSFRDYGDGEVSRWIFPFFWQFEDPENDDSNRHFWPLLGRSQEQSQTTWSTLWPLFFAASDAEDPTFSQLGYLFPFGFSSRDEDSNTNWLLPLWYHNRQQQDSTSWFLWPLFHREADADSSTWHSLFYLLRNEATPESDEFSVLYALYRGRTEGDKTTRSVPFLFHYENDGGEQELRLFHLIPIRW